MNDPFVAAKFQPGGGSLSGLVDYPVQVTPNDTVSPQNVVDKDGNPTVGIAIMSTVDGTVAYIDRHGENRSLPLIAGIWQSTSVTHIKLTGTTAGTYYVGISS